MFDEKKPPYKGIFIVILILVLPSVFCTSLLFTVISKWQPEYGDEFNMLTAKLIGCGVGMVIHMMLWITGFFNDGIKVVKNRLGDFFSDIFVSPKIAFSWYWQDIKMNGVTLLIDMFFVAVNAGVFLDALDKLLQYFDII